VVEATEPGSPAPTHEGWEPILLDAGYRCALFDGLNRFYAQADDEDALDRLLAPANVLDGFERYDLARLRAELATVPMANAAGTGYQQRLQDALGKAQQDNAAVKEYARGLEARIQQLQREAVKARRYTTALESRVEELTAAVHRLKPQRRA
jgi:hypothetical protein